MSRVTIARLTTLTRALTDAGVAQDASSAEWLAALTVLQSTVLRRAGDEVRDLVIDILESADEIERVQRLAALVEVVELPACGPIESARIH